MAQSVRTAPSELEQQNAPRRAICPDCGDECPRHSTHARKLKDINLDEVTVHEVRVGVYKCKTCDKYWTLQPPEATRWKHYSDRTREKAVKTVVQDKCPFRQVPVRMHRDFNVSISHSTSYRWIHEEAENIDFENEYVPWALKNFSGAMVVDEMHDHYVIFFATDPINDLVLGYMVADTAQDADILIFLEQLEGQGFNPKVFICDGSPLYRKIPQRIWPQVAIQQCVFHFTRNVQDDALKCLRTLCREAKEEARKTKSVRLASVARAVGRGQYDYLRRPDKLSNQKRQELQRLADSYGPLADLWNFQHDFYGIYHRSISKRDALERRDWILSQPEYAALPQMGRTLKRLRSKRFMQTLTYLNYENLPRTSNHVEQANRRFRKRQKSHYRNRSYEAITHMIEMDLMERKRDYNGRSIQKLERVDNKFRAYPD